MKVYQNCNKKSCIHYFGQCQWERLALIVENESSCEDFLSCYNADANADINIEVK